MSLSVMRKLSSAGDKVRELQSDFNNLKCYSNSSLGFDSNFSNLLMSVANFLSEVDKVYEAIDEAFDEIERINVVNKDLTEQVEKLENHIEACEKAGRV